MADDSPSDDGATEPDAIALRAYQRFEERGREHGHDLDDWLEAEREPAQRNIDVVPS